MLIAWGYVLVKHILMNVVYVQEESLVIFQMLILMLVEYVLVIILMKKVL